jgi:hypothetical protein
MKLFYRLFFLSIMTSLIGCSTITEPFKLVLGVSTKALQDARSNAEKGSYNCSYHDCFDAVLSLARGEKSPNEKMEVDAEGELEDVAETVKYFDVFRKNRKKGFIVVMGIQGQVDTTEAGIFFTFNDDRHTALDVSSLSTPAKKKVANAIFEKLDQQFDRID